MTLMTTSLTLLILKVQESRRVKKITKMYQQMLKDQKTIRTMMLPSETTANPTRTKMTGSTNGLPITSTDDMTEKPPTR